MPRLNLRRVIASPRCALPFRVTSKIPSLRLLRRTSLLKYRSVGFVPTMGALHLGHLALIRQAARENDDVYVSIYVNPAQFGIQEDLSKYPRTWSLDSARLERLQDELQHDSSRGRIRVIFMPRTEHMYPTLPPDSNFEADGSFVTVTPLSRRLEGASRPVFFRGVATVVMKLLNIVRPEKLYLGQKDIQQAFVIKQMIRDFHVDTQLVVGPTMREADGLAMSSRNVYLGERRRRMATILWKALKETEKLFAQGARQRRYLYQGAMDFLTKAQKQQAALPASQRVIFEVDYVSIADADTLEELDSVPSESGAIVSGAIKLLPLEQPQDGESLGKGDDETAVRLIDNIRLDLLSAKLNQSF